MTQVVIDDVIPRTQLVASAGQTVFNTNWTADAATDINVYRRADGEVADDITQIVSPSLYNVTFVGGSQTVRVTFLSGVVLNDVITIVRNTPAERQNLYINTNFVPSMLNQDFGILTLVDQQAQMYDTVINPGYNVSATIDYSDKILPILGAQQIWRKNETNTAFEAYTIDSTPAPSNSYFLTYGEDVSLENEQNLALLGDGILKQTVSGGFATIEIAIPGVDYLDPGMPLGTMAYQDADNVNITGGSAALTAGSVINSPSAAIDIVNKAYADSIAAGFTFKASAVVATTADLNATYANGASGVGATLTCNVNGALSIDGESPTLNARVLVKNQSTTYENGVYTATDLGSAGTPFVLTRATDFDSPAEIQPGSIIFIQDGATQADTSFVETETVISVGTSPILFTQFSQQYPLSMGNGGTGTSLMPVNNSLVYTNATNMTLLAPQNSMVLTSSAAGLPTWATTLPADLTIPTPRIAQINDANGNTIFAMNPNPAAVNYWAINNSSTGIIQAGALGTSADITIEILSKGLSGINFRTTALTNPFTIFSGTSGQHTTQFAFANTAATRITTFPDSSGTLAYLTDRDWVFIQEQTANNTATVMDFTNLTGYRNYRFVFNCLTPATNGATIGMLASINNGSSYFVSSGDYFYQAVGANGVSITTTSVTTNTYMPISNGVLGSNTNGGINGEMLFIGFSGTSLRKGFLSNTHFFNGSSVQQFYQVYGQIVNAAANAVNAIRIATTAGNIFGGTVTLYGMK